MCGIYCIENLINGKKYIGQSVNIERRFSQHKSLLNNNKHENEYLQRSWNKYGSDVFSFYILCECNECNLDDEERHYIAIFDSTNENNGFNNESGGCINKHASERTKEKVSKANKGRRHTEEAKRKMSESRKGHYISEENLRKLVDGRKAAGFSADGLKRLSEFNKGKILSEETKNKISESLKGIVRSEETKKKMSDNHANKHRVFCPQLNEYFETMTDVYEKYGIPRSNIDKCIKGERKSAGKHPVTGEKLTWVDMKK